MKAFVKYSLVGVLNTVLSYSLFCLFVFLKLHYSFALVFSYAIAIAHSYIWNRHWTFRSKDPVGMETVKFISAYVLSLFLNMIFLRIFIDGMSISPVISQAMGICLVVPVTFMLMRLWVFYDKKQEP